MHFCFLGRLFIPAICGGYNTSSAIREVCMSNRFSLIGAALFLCLTMPAKGQTPKPWTPPKTPWGDPDIKGIWPGNVGVPMQRPLNFGERATLTEDELAQKEAQAKRQAETDNQAFATSDTRVGIGPPSYWTERGK